MQLKRTQKGECFGCDRETMVRNYRHESGEKITLCHACRSAMDWDVTEIVRESDQ